VKEQSYSNKKSFSFIILVCYCEEHEKIYRNPLSCLEMGNWKNCCLHYNFMFGIYSEKYFSIVHGITSFQFWVSCLCEKNLTLFHRGLFSAYVAALYTFVFPVTTLHRTTLSVWLVFIRIVGSIHLYDRYGLFVQSLLSIHTDCIVHLWGLCCWFALNLFVVVCKLFRFS